MVLEHYTHTMSKRLQVIIDDADYRDLQRVARRHHVTVSEWVRRALKEVALREPTVSPDRKLGVVREAARSSYPTADIDTMLADIERGYLGSSR